MTYGFVVEGFNDEYKMKNVVEHALFAVTNGTRMNNRVKMDVSKLLQQCDKVFLLTDPDEAGEHLAKMVLHKFPQLERVLLDKEQCLCLRNNKMKVGVEHCDEEYLKEVLKKYL